MMKFTKFVCCFVAFFPHYLFAHSLTFNRSFTSGFYGGLMLGANITNGQWRGANTLSVANNEDKSQGISQTLDLAGTQNTSSLAGRVTAGYQLVRDNLVLAGEIGGNFSENMQLKKQMNTAITSSIPDNALTQIVSGTGLTNTTATLSGSNLYLDVKPGLLTQPTFLLYGRAGLAFLDKLSISDAGTWTQQGVITTHSAIKPLKTSNSSSRLSTPLGIRLGAGVEYLLTSRFGVSLDYTYTNYGSVTTNTAGVAEFDPASTDPVNNFQQLFANNSPSASISTHTVLLGVIYHMPG